MNPKTNEETLWTGKNAYFIQNKIIILEFELPPDDHLLKSHRNLSPNQFPPFFSVTKILKNITFDKNDEKEEIHQNSSKHTNPFVVTKMQTDKSKLFVSPHRIEEGVPKNMRIVSYSKKKKIETKYLETRSTILQKKQDDIQCKFFKIVIKQYLIKKFIDNLKKSIIFKTKPREKILKVINDQAFFSDGFNRKTLFFSFMEWQNSFNFLKIGNIIKKIRPFSPDNAYLMIFDFLQLLLIFFYFIVIPLNFGLNINFFEIFLKNQNYTFIIKTLIFSVFCCEILFNFNTAFFNKKGEIILDKIAIMKEYVNDSLLKDLLSCSYIMIDCFDIKIPIYWKIIAGALFLLRIEKFQSKIKKIEDWLSVKEKTVNFIAFIQFLLSILWLIHIFSSFWLFCGKSSAENEKNWLEANNLSNQSLLKQYFSSFYYIFLVLSKIGFTEIAPQSNYEKIYIIMIIMITFCLLAYDFGAILKILKNLNPENKEINQLRNYLNNHHLSFFDKLKIKHCFQQIYKENDPMKSIQEDEIMKKLPKKLQEELLQKMKGDFLKKIPILSRFSDESLNKILIKMEKIDYNPEDIIVSLSDDPKLFLIENGRVELYIKTNKNQCPTILQTLKNGEIFGIHSFFSGEPLVYSAKALNFASLYIIKKDFFLQIIKENLHDYETYCCLKDSMLTFQKHTDFSCRICKSPSHTLINCPHCHLILSKSQIISKETFFVKQIRSQIKRTKGKKPNSLRNYLWIKESAHKVNYIAENSSSDLFSKDSSSCSQSILGEEVMRLKMDLSDQSSEFTKKNRNTESPNESPRSNEKNMTKTEISVTSLGRDIKKGQKIKKLRSFSAINLNNLKSKKNHGRCNSVSKSLKVEMIPGNLSSVFEEKEEDLNSSQLINNEFKTLYQHKKFDIFENFVHSPFTIESLAIDSCKEYEFYFKKNNVSNVICEMEKNKKKGRKFKKYSLLFFSVENVKILFPSFANKKKR